MRGYKLSFFFAVLLIIGAFWAQSKENKKPARFRNDGMPWVLFLGGAILVTVGSAEYNREQKKKNN